MRQVELRASLARKQAEATYGFNLCDWWPRIRPLLDPRGRRIYPTGFPALGHIVVLAVDIDDKSRDGTCLAKHIKNETIVLANHAMTAQLTVPIRGVHLQGSDSECLDVVVESFQMI